MNLFKLARRGRYVPILAAATILLTTVPLGAQRAEFQPGSPELIQPEELAKVLKSSVAKPIVFNVGPRLIYVQAHIRGAEFIGPTAKPEGLEKLRARAASLPRDSFLVIYCGCCPWEHCPNIRPAYKELKQMGFTRVKVLYIATSFGTDWVDKGYPAAKGE
jgi:thiosulfate/3-mercaptopyruvate sulfurtransferase